MLYISYGLPRSGSTFAANIVELVVDHVTGILGAPESELKELHPELAGRFVPWTPDLRRVMFNSLDRPNELYFAKTHCAPAHDLVEIIDNRQIFIGVSTRNVDDMVNSLVAAHRKAPEQFAAGKTVDRAREFYASVLPHAARWLGATGAVEIEFDQLVRSPQLIAKKVASQIGVELTDVKASQIAVAAKGRFHQLSKNT